MKELLRKTKERKELYAKEIMKRHQMLKKSCDSCVSDEIIELDQFVISLFDKEIEDLNMIIDFEQKLEEYAHEYEEEL